MNDFFVQQRKRDERASKAEAAANQISTATATPSHLAAVMGLWVAFCF